MNLSIERRMEELKYTSGKKSEEVKDIIDRMPEKFGNWVAGFVLLLALIVLVGGYCIKYPDTITGQINVSSSHSPVKLVANTPGKLQLFHSQPRQKVRLNEYIGMLQNAANMEDVRRVSELIGGLGLNMPQYLLYKNRFPEDVSLGELNVKYFSFLTALKSICNYEEANDIEERRLNLTEYLKLQKELLEQTQKDRVVYSEKLEIAEKWLQRNTGLRAKDMIPEIEMDRKRDEYLSVKSNYHNLEKSLTSIHIQIADVRNKLNLLDIEQIEKENQLHLNLIASFQELQDNLKKWEENYVFKAPFDGTVEFLKFWVNDEFVMSGEEVFSVIPEKKDMIGQVVLPARGAGKIKVGDEVIIKLDNYPYVEFGSVAGSVVSISMITQQQQAEKSMIDTYLVTVALPDGLKTNYGETIAFQHALKGTADIIVKKRRLIERLFDNLKYITK